MCHLAQSWNIKRMFLFCLFETIRKCMASHSLFDYVYIHSWCKRMYLNCGFKHVFVCIHLKWRFDSLTNKVSNELKPTPSYRWLVQWPPGPLKMSLAIAVACGSAARSLVFMDVSHLRNRDGKYATEPSHIQNVHEEFGFSEYSQPMFVYWFHICVGMLQVVGKRLEDAGNLWCVLSNCVTRNLKHGYLKGFSLNWWAHIQLPCQT